MGLSLGYETAISKQKNNICLHLDNGWVNMINFMHIIEAKRIKFIHKILNSESQHRNMIGKYWLALLGKQNVSENFLFHYSNIKGLHLPIPSQSYKDGISAWSSFRGKLQTNDSIPILEQQICGNNQIFRQNILLWLKKPHLAKAD